MDENDELDKKKIGIIIFDEMNVNYKKKYLSLIYRKFF